jgi:hypothetical protein
MATVDFGIGTVDGDVISDIVSVGQSQVSHGTYRLKEGALVDI